MTIYAALFLGAVAQTQGMAAAGEAGPTVRGHVIDAESRRPIPDAVLTLADHSASTDAAGGFELPAAEGDLLVRAVGFRRARVPAGDARGPIEVALTPFRAKALYLSFYGIGSAALRKRALELVDRTQLNALVIDVKSDYGKIPYPSAVPLAVTVGAQGPTTIPNPGVLIAQLHDRGVYLIARIVVFKDVPLATARPELAVRTLGGAVWRDRERLAWTDPFRREVRDYNVDVAIEAARLGFDEIQFDYVRFPDAVGLAFSQPSTRGSRAAAINGLLREARRRLAPYNVFLSVDVFGYVCWNRDDTMIGQRLEDLAPLVDYVSPMLYPSSFQFGIPGYRNPVVHPYQIVRRSLEEARRRTGLPSVRLRPWLQAFKDYAFDRRPFAADEIRTQIEAAEQFGSSGWMLWNPHNEYSAAGLVE
jgi:hypothetical protein